MRRSRRRHRGPRERALRRSRSTACPSPSGTRRFAASARRAPPQQRGDRQPGRARPPRTFMRAGVAGWPRTGGDGGRDGRCGNGTIFPRGRRRRGYGGTRKREIIIMAARGTRPQRLLRTGAERGSVAPSDAGGPGAVRIAPPGRACAGALPEPPPPGEQRSAGAGALPSAPHGPRAVARLPRAAPAASRRSRARPSPPPGAAPRVWTCAATACAPERACSPLLVSRRRPAQLPLELR
jgi:hypothetical protein